MQLCGLAVPLVLLIVPLHASSAASPSLLLNGSFESPLIAADSLQHDTPDYWQWAASQGFLHNGTPIDPFSGKLWPSPHHGHQYVNIGNYSVFSLTQSFTVTDTSNYTVNWFDNSHIDAPSSPYHVELLSSSNAVLFAQDLDAAHAGVWLDHSFILALGSGQYNLRFTAKGQPGGYDSLLDNISISAVPELASGHLLLAGALLLSVLRRQLGKQ